MKNRLNHLIITGITSAIILLNHGVAYADKKVEIEHLLDFIAQSECTYIRNGDEYSAPEARDHIAGKYNSVKWRIKRTETFIRKIASRSSFSGKTYRIRCEDKEQPTEQWLFEELTNYRKQGQQQ